MHRQAAPEDFSALLRQAIAIKDPSLKVAELHRLAQHDIIYLQAIQLDRTLRQIQVDKNFSSQSCRLAILSSSTIDHLLPALTVASFRHGFHLNTYAAPFGQYRQELLLADSELARFQPEFVLMSLTARDVLATISLSASAPEVDDALRAHVDDLIALWRAAQQSSGATVVQQTYLNIGETMFGSLDRSIPGAPSQIVRRLNQLLVEAASKNSVLVLDLDGPVERDGLRHWFDNTKWLQAKIEISPVAAMQYADLVTHILAALKGQSKKCLVLDLDNTLWGGVVGDDGIENISLGPGSALGEAFVAFQHYIKQLKERGIILAVCSKNEQNTAESVFVEHPEMVLKRDDISAFVANWNDKASNLISIAKTLNIGLDSMVFVDDNPAERALIRQGLPMVAVPELPEDPSAYVDCLSGAGYFESVSFTNDDLQRSAQYAANKERKTLENASQSIDDYLESLEMTMIAEPFSEVDLPRVTQLINKTNQFNTTTIRKTHNEVRAISDNAKTLTLQVRLTDRFGDNGLISAIIMEPVKDQDDTYEIETWVMSCRVLGRQLEYAILNSLVALAKTCNVRHLIASYVPTPKNTLIENLYSRIGFKQLSENMSQPQGETSWKLDVCNYSDHTTQISVSN